MVKYLREAKLPVSDAEINILIAKENNFLVTRQHITVSDAFVTASGSSVTVGFCNAPDIVTNPGDFLRDISVHFFGRGHPLFVELGAPDGLRYDFIRHRKVAAENVKKLDRVLLRKKRDWDQRDTIGAKKKEEFLISLGDKFEKSSPLFELTEEDILECFREAYYVRRVLKE